MVNNQPVTKGGCFCRKITYQFEGEPVTKVRTMNHPPRLTRGPRGESKLTATQQSPLPQALCHCSVCKRLSGSLFALHYPIPPTNFTLTSGQPRTHKFTHPAGMGIEAAFCGDCGTWLYKQVEGGPLEGFYLVQAGTTDLEPGLEAKGYWTGVPAVELWVTERAPWLAPIEGAEQRPGF